MMKLRAMVGLVVSLTVANSLSAQNSSLFQATEMAPATQAPQVVPRQALPGQVVPGQVAANQVDPRVSMRPEFSTPESGIMIAPAQPAYPHLSSASWTAAVPAPARVLRLHDVISIRIDEVARMTAEGRANQRKNGQYQAALKEWLQFDGFGVKKATQSAGDPEVNGLLNEQYRATSDVVTRETLALNIAGEIADIRPNGNIVLEGHKSITINDNRWEISVSGMCQAKDITPDNVVLSKDIIDLKIDKREAGQARDGYRRGWFTEWFNRLQPF